MKKAISIATVIAVTGIALGACSGDKQEPIVLDCDIDEIRQLAIEQTAADATESSEDADEASVRAREATDSLEGLLKADAQVDNAEENSADARDALQGASEHIRHCRFADAVDLYVEASKAHMSASILYDQISDVYQNVAELAEGSDDPGSFAIALSYLDAAGSHSVASIAHWAASDASDEAAGAARDATQSEPEQSISDFDQESEPHLGYNPRLRLSAKPKDDGGMSIRAQWHDGYGEWIAVPLGKISAEALAEAGKCFSVGDDAVSRGGVLGTIHARAVICPELLDTGTTAKLYIEVRRVTSGDWVNRVYLGEVGPQKQKETQTWFFTKEVYPTDLLTGR